MTSWGPNGVFFRRDTLNVHCDHQFTMPSARQSKRPPSPTSPKGAPWRALFSRNRIIQALLTGGTLALLAGNFTGRANVETALDFFRPVYRDSYWDSHREEVKDAFVTSWDAYAKYAWGKLIDSLVVASLFPISANTNSSWLLKAPLRVSMLLKYHRFVFRK